MLCLLTHLIYLLSKPNSPEVRSAEGISHDTCIKSGCKVTTFF